MNMEENLGEQLLGLFPELGSGGGGEAELVQTIFLLPLNCRMLWSGP